MKKVDISDAVNSINLAFDLEDERLDEIGQDLLHKIQQDDMSRSEWLEANDNWLKLASQVREHKNFPWPGAANVKYPLLTLAAVQFHARALPSLINSQKPVMAKIVGKDPDGSKLKRANRVAKYMSFQILEDMEEWLDEMDRMLSILPIIGMAWKKTYYSEMLGRCRSILVLPQDLILNYHAQDLKRARLTHRIYMDPNELKELQNQEIFLDIELVQQEKHHHGVTDEVIGLSNPGGNADDEPFELYETHCWLDLDDDGYKEPYVVTLDADHGKVLRIVARWQDSEVRYGSNGKILKITPDEYFTQFIFIPDPHSPVYGVGFGSLLGPCNEAINTILNQLIDAGTLATVQPGFLARGIKSRTGTFSFKPGEWKVINTTGDDLRKSVFPMPVREPSTVLFNLLGLLIQSGEKVASVSDIMVGQNPGQNQPATTSMAVLEQGLKVFTSIYKRQHRQLGKEYQKIYKLNSLYLDEDHYRNVLDDMPDPQMLAQNPQMQMMPQQPEQIGVQDFELGTLDIRPASDPTMVTDSQKIMKSQSLLEKAMAGLPINVGIATKQMLEAEGHEDIEQLMQMPEPQPDPELVLKQQELQHKMQMEQAELQLDQQRIQSEAKKDESEAVLNMIKSQQEQQGMGIERAKVHADSLLKQQQDQTMRLKIAAEERAKRYAADQKPASTSSGS